MYEMSGTSHDASFGRLSARRLAGIAGPAGVCPDAETWAAYVDGGVAPEEQERLERHLVACTECRRLLAVLSPVDEVAPAAVEAAGGARVLAFRHTLMTRWLPLAATVVAATALWYVAAPRHAPGDATGSSAPADLAVARKAEPAAPPLQSREPMATAAAPAPRVGELQAKAAERASALAQATAPAAAPPASAADAAFAPVHVDAVRPVASPSELERLEARAQTAAELAERARRQAAAPPPGELAEAAPPPVAAPPPAAPAVSGAAGGSRADNAMAGAAPARAAEAKSESPRAAGPVPTATAGRDAQPSGFASVVFGEPEGRLRWRIVEGRRLESSSDGGTTWSARFTETSARLTAGSAPAIESAWVVGTRGTVLRLAVPGGWTRVTRPSDVALVAVSAIDGLRARVTDVNGTSYETSDGGVSWQTVGAP